MKSSFGSQFTVHRSLLLNIEATNRIAGTKVSYAHKEQDMDDRWLSVDEIAEYLGVSKDTVYSWVTGKGMPGHKVGRFWKFKKDDVDAGVRAGGASSSSYDFDEKGTAHG